MLDSPYIGRIVTLLTPIFAGLAGWVAQLAAEYLPGAPDLDETELTAIFVAGAGAAALAVYQWLKNRGAYEQLTEAVAQVEPGPPVKVDNPR